APRRPLPSDRAPGGSPDGALHRDGAAKSCRHCPGILGDRVTTPADRVTTPAKVLALAGQPLKWADAVSTRLVRQPPYACRKSYRQVTKMKILHVTGLSPLPKSGPGPVRCRADGQQSGWPEPQGAVRPKATPTDRELPIGADRPATSGNRLATIRYRTSG